MHVKHPYNPQIENHHIIICCIKFKQPLVGGQGFVNLYLTCGVISEVTDGFQWKHFNLMSAINFLC